MRAINLNVDRPLPAQLADAKREGFTALRGHPPLWGGPVAWAQFKDAIAGVDFLQNMGYGDPDGGSEHRGIRGADVKKVLDQYVAYWKFAKPERVEIGQEWNGAYWLNATPEEVAAFTKLAVAEAVKLNIPEVWVGAIDGSKKNAVPFAEALKAAGVFKSKSVGFSWHLYPEKGESLEACLMRGALMFGGIVERKRQLVTETGSQDQNVVLCETGPCVWPVRSTLWTGGITEPGKPVILVDPKKNPAANYAEYGQLKPGYYRVTAYLLGDEEGTCLLGTFDGDQAVSVPFGPSPRKVSVVIKARVNDRGMVFSLISEKPVRLVSCPPEPLDWDDARYEAERIEAKARDYRNVDAMAKRLGLAGAYGYNLYDDSAKYGLLYLSGVSKTALIANVAVK